MRGPKASAWIPSCKKQQQQQQQEHIKEHIDIEEHAEQTPERRGQANLFCACRILRSFPFWFHPPSLPSPDASSTTGSSNNRSRYRLFGQLGGGAYGEVGVPLRQLQLVSYPLGYSSCCSRRQLQALLLCCCCSVVQVWRAVSLDSEAPFEETVLKRMRCEAIATQPNGEKLEQQQQLLLQQESARVRRGFAREVFFGGSAPGKMAVSGYWLAAAVATYLLIVLLLFAVPLQVCYCGAPLTSRVSLKCFLMAPQLHRMLGLLIWYQQAKQLHLQKE